MILHGENDIVRKKMEDRIAVTRADRIVEEEETIRRQEMTAAMMAIQVENHVANLNTHVEMDQTVDRLVETTIQARAFMTATEVVNVNVV